MTRRPPKNKPTNTFTDLLRQGTRALQQGKIEQSRKLLEKAHRLDSDHPDVILNLAGAYILSKKFKEAAALLEPLSERDPNNPMIWTNLGAAYLGNPILAKDEHHQKAIAAFKTAYWLDPQTPHVAYNLGLIYRDRKENDAAVDWFKRALQANPNDKDAKHYIEQLGTENTD
ncbi:MAG: tetratricopeptide repeat protein [Chloroflexi bacterium]|nr:MAG: tetratricopeptide repeat protein [Chloroflexota bacterium]